MNIVEEYINGKRNFSGANLRGAYLRGVDLSGAYLSGANLRDANLSYTNLRGVDLSGAYLSGANLRDANLSYANLRDVDLSNAYLRGVDLSGVDLSDVIINWMSHDLIAELLFRETSNIQQRMVAGGILISKDWCWDDFLKIKHGQRKWALDTLVKYVKEGDNAPDVLKGRIKK